MSKRILYPSKETLENWVEVLKTDTYLKLSLPIIDDRWYELIFATIVRAKHSYSQGDVHAKAAELFYNINKAHDYTDGNKRSSIIVVYLFYIVNDYMILEHLDIRQMAKKVAASHGRTQHDKWLRKLEDLFKRCTRPFPEGFIESL